MTNIDNEHEIVVFIDSKRQVFASALHKINDLVSAFSHSDENIHDCRTENHLDHSPVLFNFEGMFQFIMAPTTTPAAPVLRVLRMRMSRCIHEKEGSSTTPSVQEFELIAVPHSQGPESLPSLLSLMILRHQRLESLPGLLSLRSPLMRRRIVHLNQQNISDFRKMDPKRFV